MTTKHIIHINELWTIRKDSAILNAEGFLMEM
jgi:hypothetical protein